MWSLPITIETLYLDINNATRVKQNSSLWAIGNLVVASGAELGYRAANAVQAGQLLPEFRQSRQYHYVQDHAGGGCQQLQGATQSATQDATQTPAC
jgi:hypothetical protein